MINVDVRIRIEIDGQLAGKVDIKEIEKRIIEATEEERRRLIRKILVELTNILGEE